MATDEPIKSKSAAGDSQAAKTEIGHNMALVVHRRFSWPDNGSSTHLDASKPLRETEMPAGVSEHAKTNMGQQKMALLLSLPDNASNEDDDYFKPMSKERAVVVHQQSIDVDEYVPPPPLRIVRPESSDSVKETCPGCPYRGAKKARTKNTVLTYTRRRGRPSVKIELKPASFDNSCGSSSYSKDDKDSDFEDDKDSDFEPPTPTRKRGRPRSKSTKRKMEQEPLLVDSSSSSEDKTEVSDYDGRKKYARVKGTAWDRAEEVMKKLPAQGPSFVRIMLHSHVVKGFWLGLPGVFCRKNLPKNDVDIVLEDEERHTCTTKYLAYKTALSGGWKGFAEHHHLKVGDALVFQLVQPTRFKVYILRKNIFTTTDGALGLLSLDKSRETNISKKQEKESSHKDTKCRKVPRKEKKKVPEVVTRVISSKPSSHDSDNLASEEAAGGGIRSPGPYNGDFVTVKSPMDFKIVVGDDNVVLPGRLHIRYYELCHDRKAYLHKHLPKHICPKLATWMIMQTASIAEGIVDSSAASLKELTMWKKTLESAESLGMDVTFMIKRVDELIGLINTPSSTIEEMDSYQKLKLERAGVAKEVRDVELRLSILKDNVRKMDMQIREMEEARVNEMEQAVRKLATTPW